MTRTNLAKSASLVARASCPCIAVSSTGILPVHGVTPTTATGETPVVRTASRHRGTALIELAFCMPFLAGIIGITFFFGWAYVNQQHVRTSDRYVAWANLTHQVQDADLQKNFFTNKATSVGSGIGAGPTRTLDAYVADIASVSTAADKISRPLVMDNWPRGSCGNVNIDFPTDWKLWHDIGLEGPLNSHCDRDGVEWRRGQARNEDVLRQTYLQELDAMFQNVAAPGDTLAAAMRNLYLAGW
jgi:hypothetical protein